MTTDVAFYEIKLTYLDPKVEEEKLRIPTTRLKEFFDLLPKGQMYWGENSEEYPSHGFWTDWNKLKKTEAFAIKGIVHDEQQKCPDSLCEDTRDD